MRSSSCKIKENLMDLGVDLWMICLIYFLKNINCMDGLFIMKLINHTYNIING